MMDGNRTRDAEVAALLAELEDAGGRVNDTGSRRISGHHRGTVGSTNVLDEQMEKNARRRSSANSGSRRRGTSLTASPPPPGTANGSAAAVTVGRSTFSTYAPTALYEVNDSARATPIPLGVRLAPLTTVMPQSSPSTADGQAAAALRPTPPPRRVSGSGQSGSPKEALSAATPTGISPFRPLPALSGGRVGESLAKMEAPKSGVTVHDHKKFVEQETRQKDSGKVAANAHPTQRPNSSAANSFSVTSPDAAGQGEDESGRPSHAEPYKETNFLPLMCSRYLRPAGLTPSGRWGHTLTAVDEAHLLLFGGVEVSGDESNLLCEFNVGSIAWEPAFVSKGVPPCARQGHAACAYEGRYLIVYGGLTAKGTQLLNDMHIYDVYTQTWSCLWDGTQYNKHEPAARFGHSMVISDDRLYVYGGRTLKPNGTAGTTLANADVFVFSLNSRRWRRRLSASRSKAAADAAATTTATTAATEAGSDGTDVIVMRSNVRGTDKIQKLQQSGPVNPVPRSHHAACVRGDIMYIHGGSGGGAAMLTDTWCIRLDTGVWSCVHTGLGADAVAREKHALFICGEALLVVGGCNGGKGLGDRLASKFNNFVAVLPLEGQEVPCWVPVSMGNASIVAPTRKSFGAAFHGGFVYVFGGVSGAEPATNSTVRFLAADGYVSADARATSTANDEAMRGVMQRLRERMTVPCDLYAAVATFGAAASAESVVGFHRALLQQRAPVFLEQLLACRSEPWGAAARSGGGSATATGAVGAREVNASATGSAAAAVLSRRRSSDASDGAGVHALAEAETDVVDALIQQLNSNQPSSVKATTGAASEATRRSGQSESQSAARPQVYYTLGNSRVRGLEPALTAEELSALADYITWGGLKSEFRLLLEEVEDRAEAVRDDGNAVAHEKIESGMGPQRERLRKTLSGLQRAATAFQLSPLAALCEALLAGSRRKLNAARKVCTAALRADLLTMSDASAGATMTVLFVDPHTKQQTSRSLHSAILMSSSSFFADLLRPLFSGEKNSFQIGTVAAKSTLPAASTAAAAANQLLMSQSRRAVLVGPISVPTRAIEPLVQFLYTQQLHVPRDAALDTMLGAHELGLSELQAFSESIVAREEVNFETCCAFYYLARKYEAALLEEMSLLTAVAGYAEVRHSGGYLGLSPEDQQSVDAVASELRSNSWVGAPAATTELKNAEAYAARWHGSAAT